MANKVKASHILVEKHSQAEKIHDQVTKNNFTNLAKNFSGNVANCLTVIPSSLDARFVASGKSIVTSDSTIGSEEKDTFQLALAPFGCTCRP